MSMLTLLVCLLLIVSGYGFIMPITKTDGTTDIASLISHVTLLEQMNHDSTAEIVELKSELRLALEGLKEVKADLKVNQAKVAVLESKVNPTQETVVNSTDKQGNECPGSTTFTRWGRTTCPPGNRIIYKGYTGGTRYSFKASSATILCLPDHPIYDEHTPGEQESYIYGTEYETAHYTGSHLKTLQDEDMPCVVCESESKRSVIMVPARNQCYPGWNLEYKGYLMGASHEFASAEFICVDNDAESITRGQADMDGQVLYLVESKCGSLPCPPYKDDWELTCAVCSQ